MSLDAKAIGARIRRLRVAKGLTQESFAKANKTHRATVSLWETGQRLPGVRWRAKLAKYFKVSIEFISCDPDGQLAELREMTIGQSRKILENENSSAAQRQMAAKVAWLPSSDADKTASAREKELQQLMRDAGEEFLRKLARLRLDES
jgi:transcriptional regulator with XRE-family HTH domain